MLSLNSVELCGNVGSAPEIGFTQGGLAIAKFSMAVSKRQKDGTYKTFWYRLTAFGERVKYIEQYVGKGAPIFVRGDLEPYEYTPDGASSKVTTYNIVVREIQPNNPPRAKDEQGAGDAPAAQPVAQPPGPVAVPSNGGANGRTRMPPPPPSFDPMDCDVPF